MPRTIEPEHEEREGRRRREAEVGGAPRYQERRAREQEARKPGLSRPDGHVSAQVLSKKEHPHTAERCVDQVDDVERGHHAQQRLQRHREEVSERGVVVEAEVHPARHRHDVVRREWRVVPDEQFLPEDPCVPHVGTRVAAGIPGERIRQMERQRPCLDGRDGEKRCSHEGECGGPGACHAGKAVHGTTRFCLARVVDTCEPGP